ncbi:MULTISPECIES: response regulator transcription factor [unclassified Arthrobacter]|uniref:response regulator transcription factor n=1 Tax=unclassified Arthrobacter TaxID=235627 RepID=UPI001491882E|nr:MULTISPECIES: response regulator transcription factor [unclassified Arthrobacter]MBE0009765.1 DNA-binding response regulator [Arthrobacter sp. AET 35A]NOJ63543.1 response regulator transcription factor [Arthrobacter sp. 147(2020)]
MGNNILLVEDDDGIALPLLRTFEREGYAVTRVTEGLEGIRRATEDQFDLIVLDLGLPDIDGLEVCRKVREDGYANGILILTARGGEIDRVVGLDVGADDYMAKPFGLAELLARTRALLRRAAPANRPTPSPAPDDDAAPAFLVDLQARRAFSNGKEMPLTVKEFDVLATLDSSRGAVITREQLMDQVWDQNWFGSTKTLDVTIGRLRQKLDDSGGDVQVVTVRGVGFRLETVN